MNLMAEHDAPARTDLSDLVRARRQELRLSLRAVQDRTVDPASGEPLLKYSWIDRLEKGQPVIPPQYPQLRALATALQLPLAKIQDAAGAQFFGIDTVWAESHEARALVRRADRMTPEQLRQLMRLIDTLSPPE
ncbi:XRE family transcriptional regulator [Streptomyces sp. NPDC057963]|uniref:XRE family transcriptional regulator n=1 Tax=Streptomyces sp. NPDC057963 TaxID=3346290 RepID=UPI0036E2280C